MRKCSFLKSKVFLFLLALCAYGIVDAQTYQAAIKETNGDWTIPANVSKVKAEAWGGGGAGGYSNTGGFMNYKSSGGGGGGAYAGAIFSVDLNGTKKINVSNISAGTSNSNSSSVTNGGNTTVKYNNSTKVVAEGGKSVTGNATNAGANGGKAENCTGTWKNSGGKGGNGGNGTISGGGGGGGGAAGSADNASGSNGDSYALDVNGVQGGESGGDLGGKGGDGGLAGRYNAGIKYGGGGSGRTAGKTSPWGSNFGGVGGSGAIGCVRFTYMPFYINNATASAYPSRETEVKPVSNLSNLKYRVENQGTNSNVTYTVNVDNADKIIISNVTNSSNQIQSVTIKLAGVWEDNIDTERGFDTLTRFFLVSLDIYPTINPGVIGEEIVTCTPTDTIKKFTNVESASNNINASGTQINTYCWQFSEDNTTWTLIAGATGETYTPNGETNKTGWFRRGAFNDVKETVYSNAIHTSVGNVQPGEISLKENATQQGEYCIDEEIKVDIKANPIIDNSAYQAAYTIQWQKRINDGEWKDIEGATGDEYTETFKLETANDGGIADSVHIRYLFKFAECAIEPSNNTYKQKILVANDYYSPILTSDQEITLWYTACDTAIVIPTLVPEPLSIECSETRLAEGEHTVTWTVREPCGGMLTYEQKFTVKYPECEQNVDINGISYPVVRVGCDCWLAENLRAEAENATFYNNDEANMVFGRLYSWNAAIKGLAAAPSQNQQSQGNNSNNEQVREAPVIPNNANIGNTYNEAKTAETKLGIVVQGICPDGWAIPSTEQFYALSNIADATKLKSSNESMWLIGSAGVEPVSGFNAVGAGYFDSQINAYYELLGTSQIWTREITPNSVKGTCCAITYSCPDIQIKDVNKTIHNSVRCVRVEPKSN